MNLLTNYDWNGTINIQKAPLISGRLLCWKNNPPTVKSVRRIFLVYDLTARIKAMSRIIKIKIS